MRSSTAGASDGAAADVVTALLKAGCTRAQRPHGCAPCTLAWTPGPRIGVVRAARWPAMAVQEALACMGDAQATVLLRVLAPTHVGPRTRPAAIVAVVLVAQDDALDKTCWGAVESWRQTHVRKDASITAVWVA